MRGGAAVDQRDNVGDAAVRVVGGDDGGLGGGERLYQLTHRHVGCGGLTVVGQGRLVGKSCHGAASCVQIAGMTRSPVYAASGRGVTREYPIFKVESCIKAENRPFLSKRVKKCRTKVEWFDKLRLHFPGKSGIFDNGVAIRGVF